MHAGFSFGKDICNYAYSYMFLLIDIQTYDIIPFICFISMENNK